MTAETLDHFPRGIVCRHAPRLRATADAVWRLVGNIGDVSVAKEFIERIDVEGHEAGAVRTLRLRNGAVLKERIEEYSTRDRCYSYRVIDSGPLDFTHYFAVASVVPAGPRECIFLWITTATAVDGKEEEVRSMLDNNILRVLASVRSLVEGRGV